MSRRNTIEVNAYVDVDLDDELDDETLLRLARERGLIGGDAPGEGAMTARDWWESLAEELRTAAHNGERVHLDVLLHRMVNAAAPQPIPQRTAKTGRLHA